MGNTEIEDSLDRLDKLTQEEARMASAELLKITHSVDDRVKGVEGNVQEVHSNVLDVGNKVEGVDSRVQGVDNRVQGVDNRVQGVDNTLQGISSDVQGVDDKLDQVYRSLSFNTHHSERSHSFTGNQLRDSLLRWLSPPDPSINHNIASKAHHNGTGQWFLQGSIFSKWKSTDPFLWMHGKRVLLWPSP